MTRRLLAPAFAVGIGAILLWQLTAPRPSASERAEPPRSLAHSPRSSDGGVVARDAARPPPEGGCLHPLLPPVGTTLRYRLLAGTDTVDYTFDVETQIAPLEEDPERTTTINLRIAMLHSEQVLITHAFAVSCGEGGLGDPWLAWPERATGLDLEGSGWAWPRDLEVGDLTGVVALARPGQDPIETIQRAHHIGPTEDVTVPAGRFSARRVEYEERRTVGDQRGTDEGTLWLAQGVGLVRATSEPDPGLPSELVLVSIDGP